METDRKEPLTTESTEKKRTHREYRKKENMLFKTLSATPKNVSHKVAKNTENLGIKIKEILKVIISNLAVKTDNNLEVSCFALRVTSFFERLRWGK